MQRALSMSEAAGFQAPLELINAMELLSGEMPYPVPDASGPGEACGDDDAPEKSGSNNSGVGESTGSDDRLLQGATAALQEAGMIAGLSDLSDCDDAAPERGGTASRTRSSRLDRVAAKLGLASVGSRDDLFDLSPAGSGDLIDLSPEAGTQLAALRPRA